MNNATPGFLCPQCQKMLQVLPINADLSQCAFCNARLVTDCRYHDALARASVGEAWIDYAAWKEVIRNDLLAIALFPLNLIRIVNLVIAGIATLILAALGVGIIVRLAKGDFAMEEDLPSLRPTLLLVIPLVLVFVLPRVERFVRRNLPNQFVFEARLITSSSGLAILTSNSEPIFFPWSSIVSASFSTGTAVTQLQYWSSNSQIGTATLQGNEYAEVLDILRRRRPDLELTEYGDLTF